MKSITTKFKDTLLKVLRDNVENAQTEDLRQHRITSYSTKKNGKAHHKIVGYNFSENKIEDKVHLYHPADFYNIKSELIDASKELVENISKIRIGN